MLAHHLADPGKGTGIAMVCTFGDASDVTWWRELGLPARPVTGKDGRFLACPPAAITSRAGRGAYGQLAGETAAAARQRITGLLRSAGDLLGDPEPVRHAVNFYEKGSQPLEIITSQQWYLRNGGRDPELAQALLDPGPGDRLAPRPHAGPVRELGERPEQRLAGQPAAVLRRADPDLVPARRRGPAAVPGTDHPPGRQPAGRSHGRHAARIRRLPARPSRRFRRRPGRARHLGHVLAHPADRRPLDDRRRPARPGAADGSAAAGARDHPHVAVLHAAALACPGRHPAVAARGDLRLGTRPRPQEDVQVGRERGHPDGLAARARQRRGPLLGGQRPPRRRRGLRPGPAEGRPAARDQDTQRQPVRALARPALPRRAR